jgi:hypothetical protein
LFEDSVLLSEVLDDCILLAADPAGQGGDEDLPRLQSDGHPQIVALTPSIGQLFHTVRFGLFFPGFCSIEYLDITR